MNENKSRLLTVSDVLIIPKEDLPLMVLSRNYYSRIATEISIFDRSLWNHFMWMAHPGKVVTQDMLLREVPIINYLNGKHSLKFWTCSSWPTLGKLAIIKTLEYHLSLPWYKRRYDILQILGIKLHLRRLQIPWLNICSDWADVASLADKRFNKKYITPGEVNEWCKSTEGYIEYGKFFPND